MPMEIQMVPGTEPTPEQIQKNINIAFQDANVPKFYMNGFNIGNTLSDIIIAMIQNGRICGMTNMSYTTAKTLMLALQEATFKYEQQTGQEILTMKEIQQKIREGQPKQ